VNKESWTYEDKEWVVIYPAPPSFTGEWTINLRKISRTFTFCMGITVALIIFKNLPTNQRLDLTHNSACEDKEKEKSK